MVLLFGNKSYGEHLGYIVTRCPTCKADRVFYVHQERQKLTIYFVPTVQYRVKQYMTCLRCRERFEIADELKPEIAERLMSEQQLKTIVGDIVIDNSLPVPRCAGCSQPIETGMRFCPNCGKPLK